MMFKKALMPLIWILLAVVALAVFAWFMQAKWGEEGPFPEDPDHAGHHH